MHPLLRPRPHLLPALLASLLCAPAPAWAAAPAHPPLALHPDNPRYFLFRGAPTIIIGSGEHCGAVLNLDFDFEAHLDTLRACGLNHTRTFSGVYREIPGSFGITDNPLAPAPGRYICPWPRSQTPGASDGGARFDLAKWDEPYFGGVTQEWQDHIASIITDEESRLARPRAGA